MSNENKRPLSLADARVRAVRDHLWSARTHIEIAMQFVMHPEMRTELRQVLAELAHALDQIGR